jgi:hypothetical protein
LFQPVLKYLEAGFAMKKYVIIIALVIVLCYIENNITK